MFCTKCGKQVPDGSVICPHCGNALAAPQAAPKAAPQPLQAVNNFAGNVVDKAKKGDKKTLVIGAIVAVVAVIAIVALIMLLFGNGPKSVVKKALKKGEALDKKQEDLAETYLLFYNKKARKKLDMDEEDEDEKSVKKSWKVTKAKKYGKNDDVTEGMRAYVADRGGDEDKVKAAALVEVTETTKVKGEDPEKVKKYYALVKVGGKWYLLTGAGNKAENINKAADKWEAMAGSDSKKKKNSDDDDDD